MRMFDTLCGLFLVIYGKINIILNVQQHRLHILTNPPIFAEHKQHKMITPKDEGY